MFDESSEFVLHVYPGGIFTMRIRCIHGDDASVIPVHDLSVEMWQKLLHHVTQEKFMRYSDEFGLSFCCPVTLHTDNDGKLQIKIVHD